jgi:hypothetical protein
MRMVLGSVPRGKEKGKLFTNHKIIKKRERNIDPNEYAQKKKKKKKKYQIFK